MGETARLEFVVQTDGSLNSNFFNGRRGVDGWDRRGSRRGGSGARWVRTRPRDRPKGVVGAWAIVDTREAFAIR